jgi:hypothetical protein
MKTVFTISVIICMYLWATIAWSDIIHVPGDYPNIQAGIDAASDGDTVLAADGTYTGSGNKNLDFNGKAITVESENGAENCIIDCEEEDRAFYFHSGETSEAVVRGFKIINARINGNGGGIYCGNSSSPTIESNIIMGNRTVNGHGGGIYCENSSPTIQYNEISWNTSDYSGGGIACIDNSSSTIQNNRIIKNRTIVGDQSGGGISCHKSSPIIRNNVIIENESNHRAGGISCEQKSSPAIIFNTIVGNSASSLGGGICCLNSSSPTILNTILWADSPDEIYIDGTSGIDITYSDIQGGWPGEGNIDADPLFGNPYSGLTYDLKPGSPCINAGTSSGAPSTDIVGRSRPSGSGVDIGAYEQNDDGTLAVELSLFTASVTNDGVIIRWRTESETNNVGFTIYRSESKDGNYTKIAFVSGAGNTGMPTDYQFFDTKVEPGKTYFYYLEDIDITGERNKSDIIKVVVPAKSVILIPKDFALLQNYPNPFNPETWIPFKLARNALVTIHLYSTKGQLIRTISLGTRNAGIYTTKDKAAYWDGRDNLGQKVSSGVYYYTMQAGEFRATRKMVIVK